MTLLTVNDSMTSYSTDSDHGGGGEDWTVWVNVETATLFM